MIHTENLPLFRATDPATSRDAAERVRPKLSELQREVLLVWRNFGPMTAKEGEQFSAFRDLAPSTVRCRVSALARMGLLRDTGQRRDGCTVYEAAQ